LTLAGGSWDHFYGSVFFEVPQVKVSDYKIVPFGAGSDRYCDWFVSFGDYLMTGSLKKKFPEQPMDWLLPNLPASSSPGRVIGDIVKGLLPHARGGMRRYEIFAMEELPPKPSAAGFRKGACNEMASGMPAEFVKELTGHDLSKISALFEYIEATRALTMPGCAVLLGGLRHHVVN
jgi:hypothetical protein